MNANGLKSDIISKVGQKKGKKKSIYWLAQFFGWFSYVFLTGLINHLNDSFNVDLLYTLVVVFFLGVTLSHLYRGIVIRYGWLKKSPLSLVPRIIGLCLLFGFSFALIYGGIADAFFEEVDTVYEYPYLQFLSLVLSFSFVYLLWLLFYFTFNFFENYRTEEIKNLQLEAAKNEIELSHLRSQLNPHFMFNAMNSIRALVEENPEQAKTSITKLSSILRNSLVAGKKKQVEFKEELDFVKDYLSLEQVRYEERLRVSYQVEEGIENVLIPPLIIQTLVENGIKHGISHLPQGGDLVIEARKKGEVLEVKIKNTGSLNKKSTERGIGIKNTEKRLELLYGNHAKFDIFESDGMVVSQLQIPLDSEHKN